MLMMLKQRLLLLLLLPLLLLLVYKRPRVRITPTFWCVAAAVHLIMHSQ
jgi:hypothetical protein